MTRLTHRIRLMLLCMLIWGAGADYCHAQEKRSTKERIGNALSLIDYFLRMKKTDTDTAYVHRPSQPLTLKLRYDYKSTYFSALEVYEGTDYTHYFENKPNSSVAISANYRGLSVALSLNPQKMFGKSKDTEFNFNYYNNKFGLDITYSDVKRFRSSTNFSDLFIGGDDVFDWEHARLKSYSANVYYVFNNRRFSYPAAFSHSWVQKKSSGSLLAGISCMFGNMDFDLSTITPSLAQDLDYMLNEIKMRNVTLKLGYAYNFVPNKHWLIHASFTPGIMLWKKYDSNVYDLNVDGQTQKVTTSLVGKRTWPRRFLDWAGTLRIGPTYYWKNYFIGTSFIMQFDDIGDDDIASLYSNKWKWRTYFGIRL